MGNPEIFNSAIRILLVDDFEPWRRYISSMLETRSEYQVAGEAADGLQAVQRAEELQPDIVLLDLSMPTLNGIDACKIIRKRCPKSTIIFLTENADGEIREAALRTGARGYVLKAHAARELLDAIKAAMRDTYTAVSSAHPR